MKKIKILTIIAIFALLQISCTDSTSGGETLNEKVALYMPDGITPAVDATVKFFSIGDTSATPIYQTQTDAEGRYSVSGVTSTGYYNVIAEYEDSLFTMQDTVYISQESNMVKDDTLNNPGSISGIVALQPNHSHLLNNIYVMALGMGRAVNVDSTGWFTMTKLAPGDYNLQFDTDIENYGPRFIDVTISSSVNDTLSDTITLPYSGVPVVTGIRSSYDTLNGVATINWKKSSYGNVYSYLVFRKPSDSLFFPEDPIGWVSSSDTYYNDTIFTKPVIDSATRSFDYTIAILDSSTAQGPINSYINVIGISPLKVTTIITSQIYNKVTQSTIDTFSTTDTIHLTTTATNIYRNYRSISWAINHPDSIINTFFCDSSPITISDTLIYNFSKENDYKVFVSVEDLAGTMWYDTITVHVWNYPTPVNVFVDSIFAFTANLRWTKSSETNFTNYKVYQSTSPTFDTCYDTLFTDINDTTLTLSNLIAGTIHYFKVGVQISNNTVAMSNISSDTTKGITSIASPMPTARYSASSEIVNNKIYTIGGGYINSNMKYLAINNIEIYDIATNSWTTKDSMIIGRQEAGSCVHNDEIYIIGGSVDSSSTLVKTNKVEVYNTISGLWTSKTPLPTATSNLTVELVKNKIYAIGGTGSNKVEVYDITIDSWTTIASLPDYFDHVTSVTLNDTIFIFGRKIKGNRYCYTVHKLDETANSLTQQAEIELPNTKDGTISNSWENNYNPIVFNNNIYLFGVFNNRNYIIHYDHIIQKSQILLISLTSNLNQTNSQLPASRSFVSDSNKLYQIGGIIANNFTATGDVEILSIPKK